MILREGTYLQNRYEILERIGSGGMSEVYKARDRKLNRLVAIKVLKEEYCDNAEFVSKFKFEAQSAAGLSHPNVVSVYDVIDEGELHYIVMELVEGVTLKEFILAKGRLDIKEAIVISIQVAQGIGAAHDQNIVHRDIKPQNMIMSADGKVKVADFGIAGAVSSDTINSIAIGSVHYLSPEQAKGETADERSDIYSLGITMYEMITGQLPFKGDTTVSVAIQQIENDIPLPSLLNPAVTPAYETIILKCTQKRPERRYQNIADLVVDLRKALMDPAAGGMVTRKNEEDEYHTKVISPEELGEINSQAKIRNEKNVKNRRSKSASLRDQLMIEEEEEEETGSDKLLTVLGIILAVIIVGAAIFFITRFTGLVKNDAPISSILQPNESSLPDTQVYMPNVIEMTADLAAKMLREDYSLEAKFKYVENAEFEKGKVVDQDPAEGEVVDKYSYVTLYVSQGTNTISLENAGIFGEQLDTVKKMLDKMELSCKVQEDFSDNIEAGCVIDYNPKLVEKGGEVVLTVSKGPQNVNARVPVIIGLSEDDAIALLAENELLPGDVTQVPADVSGMSPGLVCSQAVAADTEIAKQTRINYSISVEPSETESSVEDPSLVDPLGPTLPGLPTGSGSYVASINETFDLENKIGPGAVDTSIFVTIKLVQTGPDGTVYESTLMQPREIIGNTIIPVRFKNIEGVYGLDRGEVQIVNANTGELYKSYTVEFFNVD